MRNACDFAWHLLISPSKALRRLQAADAALAQSASLYVLFWIASIAFYAWKPEGFPPPDPDSPITLMSPQAHDLLFWISVHLWDPVLSAIWIVSLAALIGFFQSAFAALPIQIGIGALTAAAPFALAILCRKGIIPGFALVLFWAILFGLFYRFMRRRSKPQWKSLISMALALNIVSLAGFILLGLAVALWLPTVYNGIQYAIAIWSIGLGTYLLSRLDKISTARACVAFILSLIWQLQLILTLHTLGLVPTEVLKGMMSL